MKLFSLTRMTTATTGAGTITLAAAVSGYLTFSQGGALDGDLVEYAIWDGASSEIGYGTYSVSGPTLTRNVTRSTNSNSAINLSGAAQVFISPRAEMLLGGDGRVITPEMYGAKGDGIVNANGGAITSGTNSFTQSGYSFVSSDAGKYIAIDGAGAAGATLATTISSASGGAAILAVNASTTVTTAANEWGTNDSVALHNMAAASAGKKIWFGAGKVYFHTDSAGNPNLIRFGTGPFSIEGNSATVKAMATAPSACYGLMFCDATFAGNGPANFDVRNLIYNGNRTRRISTGAIPVAVGSGSGFYFIGCQYFGLYNLIARNTTADGGYIGGDTRTGRASQFWNVVGGTMEDAGRNGWSLAGASYGFFTGISSQNHSFGNSLGNISYALDFEPDGSWNTNANIFCVECIASNCQTGFGSNITNGSNTSIVWDACRAEACTAGFYESAVGTTRVYAPQLSGNTTNFTNLYGYVGYQTGEGGSVTQATSRTTGVTINKTCGAITLVSATGAAAYSTFTVTNSTVASTDTVVVHSRNGSNIYNAIVTQVVAGSFNVSVASVSGVATEAPTLSFGVIKAVSS